MENPVTLFIIDDEHSVRRSLSIYLTASGYTVETYGSSEEYLARENFEGAGCIILDVNLGGKTGMELQDELISRGSLFPVIFITGHGTIPMSVEALKKGAHNFLEKPFRDGQLLQSVSEAVTLSQKIREENELRLNAEYLVETLTPRENEILRHLITGMLNKQIADTLGIAEHTVKIHRQSICEKLGVKSVPEILRIADKAGVVPFFK